MALTVRIKKRYGDFLLDVDFSAESGVCLALLGASGCGKSTALKCVAGIHRPDWGRVELDGRVLFDSQRGINLPPQRRRVGYLFQQYALFPHMTAEQNIAACLGHLGRGERRARLAELMALLHLEGLGKLRPRQLSGGQQQRVALARMLAAQPAAILLDEPLSALDSSLRWQLEWELREVLSRFGGPVVWVSHDRGEIFRSCRRVCVLDRGRSAPAMSVEELLRNPGTVSAARLSGCRNCVPVEPGPAPGSVSVPAWGLVLRSAAPWREGVSALGVHACHVRPGREGEVNAFLCETLEAVEDVSTVLAALRPVGAPEGAPPLWMELDRGTWAALPDRRRFWAEAAPDRLLLLE